MSRVRSLADARHVTKHQTKRQFHIHMFSLLFVCNAFSAYIHNNQDTWVIHAMHTKHRARYCALLCCTAMLACTSVCAVRCAVDIPPRRGTSRKRFLHP